MRTMVLFSMLQHLDQAREKDGGKRFFNFSSKKERNHHQQEAKNFHEGHFPASGSVEQHRAF
jgi:hypothetical protein